MDIKKILLYFVVALLGTMIWMAWQKDYPAATADQASSQSKSALPSESKSSLPQDFTPPSFRKQSLLSNPRSLADKETATNTQSKHQMDAATAASAALIEVQTDIQQVKISKVGGNIVGLALPDYPVSAKKREQPIQILTVNPEKLYTVQNGINNIGQEKLVFTASQSRYDMQPDQQVMAVTLTAKTKSGLVIVKTLHFTRGSYAIKQSIKVTNAGSNTWKGSFFNQITRKNNLESDLFSRSYNGAAVSSHEHPYQKLSFKDMSQQNLSKNIEDGWIAMQQPYFLSAWVANTEIENHYYSKMFGDGEKGRGNVFVLGFVSPEILLAPGASTVNQSTLYVGPELEEQLKTVARGLELTINYGWFWFLSEPIFYVMSAIHKAVGNWGWSIVLITLLIKVIFYPLSAKSYKSMAKMRDLAPKMQSIKERYKDDKQALGRATMDFYKREKVSPVGGCLPMMIQIPVFIALYYVLIESVQLRQAPFVFWIQDLSIKDPYHVLPILMAASMLLQQKLSPPPPDPTQAKMMMLLPLVFLFVFWSFPAGLVLYWLTNNVLSITQQWYVMNSYDPKKERVRNKYRKKK